MTSKETVQLLAEPAPVELVHRPLTAIELIEKHPSLNKTVIEGLLREAEIMNLIAASKTGKSWLVLSLCLSFARGDAWLDHFAVNAGKVLLIDNELHAGTLANRIKRVADAMGIGVAEYGDNLHVEVMRGHLKDLFLLGEYFDKIEPNQYRVIVLDAFYRFIPAETDENSNADMSNLYNILDSHAQRLNCAFILIHHASKGSQSDKNVTDVGSGAGAMSRATDTHLILRPHEENDVIILDAAVRSWAPVQPICLRWTFPVWAIDDSADPTLLRRTARRTPKNKLSPTVPAPARLTPAQFAAKYLKAEPEDRRVIIARAVQDGVSNRNSEQLFTLAVAEKHAYKWSTDDRRQRRFATVEQTLLDVHISRAHPPSRQRSLLGLGLSAREDIQQSSDSPRLSHQSEEPGTTLGYMSVDRCIEVDMLMTCSKRIQISWSN